MEQQIEHVSVAIHASGMKISKTEATDIASMHSHAASMYGQAAAKAKHRMEAAQRAGNRAMMAKMQEVYDRLRQMADEHGVKAKKYTENLKHGQFAESVQPKQSVSTLSNFRRLAGIEETVQMPRDPGLLGTTRFNAGYDEMAKPFDEAEDTGHKKRMKAVAKKVHQAGSAIDREYESDDDMEEGRSKDQQAAGLKKITKAALAHGDSDFFTLKTSKEARKAIKDSGGRPDARSVNKHMARDIVDKATPWDPLAKGNKESPQRRLADLRLGRGEDDEK
jgi:hypothetical protein